MVVLSHSSLHIIRQPNVERAVFEAMQYVDIIHNRHLKGVPPIGEAFVPKAGFKAAKGGQARTPLRLPAEGGDSGF